MFLQPGDAGRLFTRQPGAMYPRKVLGLLVGCEDKTEEVLGSGRESHSRHAEGPAKHGRVRGSAAPVVGAGREGFQAGRCESGL